MELTHLFVVHLLAVLSVHALSVRGNAGLDITEEAITEEQQKVHDECRNPDYKRYVKCLMRPKRQHHTNHGDGMHESGRPSIAYNNRDKRGNSHMPPSNILRNCSCYAIIFERHTVVLNLNY